MGEIDEQQMKDSDMIYNQIRSAGYESWEEAQRAIVNIYVPERTISRAGISHAIKRLEEYYKGVKIIPRPHQLETAIDRKFQFMAVNPVNKKIYTDQDAIVFCAKDVCVPPMIEAYIKAATLAGANLEHIDSMQALLGRVRKYQDEIEAKVPDTVGDEIDRCLHGINNLG